MENYDEHDKNYGALVNSISVAMVDKARGILMDLPKTMPRLQYKSQTSGLSSRGSTPGMELVG